MTIASYALAGTSNQRIVDLLNKLIKLDPDFTKNIVDTRYPVNQAYLDSKEFVSFLNPDGSCCAGLLGVLNSVIVMNECFRIAGVYNDANELQEFTLIELKSQGE